jgi:hypothetical protein
MELTQTEAELTESIKTKPLPWVKKYKDFHYGTAIYYVREARRQKSVEVRDSYLLSARVERGLARVARREIQRRRDDIEKDFV